MGAAQGQRKNEETSTLAKVSWLQVFTGVVVGAILGGTSTFFVLQGRVSRLEGTVEELKSSSRVVEAAKPLPQPTTAKPEVTPAADMECVQRERGATIDGKVVPVSDWLKDCAYQNPGTIERKRMKLSTWGLVYEYSGSNLKTPLYVKPQSVFVVPEHSSVFAGYSSKEGAIAAYRKNFPNGPNIEEMRSMPQNYSDQDWGIFGKYVKTVKFDENYNFDELAKQIEETPEVDTIVLSFYTTVNEASSKNPIGFKKYIRLNDHIPAKTGAMIGKFIMPNGRELDILHYRPAPEGELALTVSR